MAVGDQTTADDAGMRRPFDLVNEFASRQRAMRPASMSPNRRAKYDYMRQLAQNHLQRRGQQGGAPARGAAPPRKGLMDWNGRKIDSSVLRYANEISRQFPKLRFSSGYRDPAANARANGVPNSFHLSGRALDFSGSSRDMQNAKVWAERNGAREALIHNAGSGTHLHVAW